MTEPNNIYEEITALVDNRLSAERKRKLDESIRSDENLQFEYHVQSSVKNLLRERFAGHTAPVYLYENVMNNIQSNNSRSKSAQAKSFSLREVFSILSKPRIAFAVTAILAIIFFISMPFQKQTELELIEQQSGEFNMWIQANNNFQKLTEGSLSAQIASNNPQEIKQFFAEQGVNYNTIIPECENWNLAGAVVSVDKGSKFAHHVYTDNQGHLIYVYQVSSNYFTTKPILDLSDDLFNFISNGNIIQKDYENHVSFLLKGKDNIFAVVANETPEKVQSDLIAQLQ
ncbi:MAG: hypothetical protein U5K00_19205 [Melioribacteraceae bacterium]|nr:hypothetical protein [Melioribacteraceae bacterium]